MRSICRLLALLIQNLNSTGNFRNNGLTTFLLFIYNQFQQRCQQPKAVFFLSISNRFGWIIQGKA